MPKINFLNLSVRAATADTKKRTVDAVFATENPTQVVDWDRWEVIEEVLVSRGMREVDQIPLMDNHGRTNDDLRGSIRDIRNGDGENLGTLHFARDEVSQRRWEAVQDGHLRDISVGYRPEKWVDIERGQSAVVNGRTWTAGERFRLRITTDWTSREGSLTPIGADPFSRIREELGGDTVPLQLRQYLESVGLVSSASEPMAWRFYGELEGSQREEAARVLAAIQDPPNEGPPESSGLPVQEIRESAVATLEQVVQVPTSQIRETAANAATEAIRSERQRVASIREMAGDDVPAETVDQAINEGWDLERCGTAFLTSLRTCRASTPNPPAGPAIHSRDHSGECNIASLSASLIARTGGNPLRQEPGPAQGRPPRIAPEHVVAIREQDADRGDRFLSMSLYDICRESYRMTGRTVPRSRDDMIRGAFSNAALVGIFTTTANAALISSYDEAPDTTNPWTVDADFNNFQPHERTRLGKMARMEKLTRGDRAKHGTMADITEIYKLARYAKQLKIDDQDIYDDSLDGLSQLPREMGRSAARLRPDLVYSQLFANRTLASGVPLFDPSHNNLRTTAPLTDENLKVAITDMGTQTEDGAVLDLFGMILGVPMGLKHDASQLINSAEIRSFLSTGEQRGTMNPLKDDNLGLISDPRLDLGVTDPDTGDVYAGSATTWYLWARESRHTIEVAYLTGSGRRPTMRAFVLDRGEWGIGWDIKLDIAAKPLDYRGLHKNTA